MRASALVLIKISITVSLLTGCSATDPGRPAPSPVTPTGTAGTAASTPTAVPTATAASTPTAGDATANGTEAAEPAPARITLTRSGGFAGNRDTVTVEPDGRWSTTDRSGTARTGRLTPAQLDRLRALTGPATRSSGGGPPDARCADTFTYRLTVGTRSVDWTDCPDGPQPPAAAPELATLLLKTTATG
ncbi:hypothetical protein [Micromonospora sp. NBC_00421]|uniref:hypothetical protein n=1 Tax=Micromonospora sp. NBC_00421 TaxID=2975976 RepID=UPI002E1CC1C1